MDNDIILSDKGTQLSYSFNKPEKALYITHPSWILEARNIITEDQRYVMGLSHLDTDYKPVPFETFKKSIENLAKRKAMEIRPSEMYESIDFDPLEASIKDKTYKYILDMSGVLIRLRNDGKEGVHTMSLIGNKESLIEIAETISLPHPFDFEKYSYKKIFKDASGASGKILALN